MKHILAVIVSACLFQPRLIPAQELFTKPEWLPQLSLGLAESYDDNILGVSGNGLQPKASWVTRVSPGIGFNFAPLLDNGSGFKKLSLGYTPDIAVYHNAPEENYTANRFGTAVKGNFGDFSVSIENSFLYNDGNRIAPTYALNQFSGPLANSLDRYRNQFANTPARERRNQVDDTGKVRLQYDVGRAFVRGSASLLYYNMDTVFHNTSKAPYLGYQNYPDRSDVNGGVDFGYKVLTNVALTAGYRYGSQYQQQFDKSITSDQHYSSSTYQRILFGLEAEPFQWLTAHFAGGPDFRDYNSHAPVRDFHPARYYGEAGVTGKLPYGQSVSFDYEAWSWVASSGEVPEYDTSYVVDYRWKATKQWELGVRGKILQADYTIGNDTAGTAPSVRIDRLYSIAPRVTYAFTEQLSATLSYTYNAGNNELTTIPPYGTYKNFVDQIVSLGLLYKF